jgi:hypothetical protein
MAIIQFSVGDMLVMKKKHPCGTDTFKVARCGSDVRLICTGCGRDLMLDRVKVEKSIKKVVQPSTVEEI